MTQKQFLVIISIAIILCVIGVFMVDKDKEKSLTGEKSLGTKIFQELPLNDVRSVKINAGGGKTVTLRKPETAWEVSDLYSYPANFDKIADFIRKLGNLKVAQNVIVDDAGLASLGLLKGDQPWGGAEIDLAAADGKKLATFLVGKKRTKAVPGEEFSMPEGRYVLVSEKPRKVVVVNDQFNEADTTPKDWLDKSFISASNLKSAELSRDGSSQWGVKRAKQTDTMAPQDVPEGREVDAAKVSRVANCLSNLDFDTIADPVLDVKDTGLDSPSVFTAETFNGLKYVLLMGKEKNAAKYVKLSVAFTDYPLPEGPADEKAEDKEKRQKSHDEEVQKLKAQATSEQAKLNKWTYMVSNYRLDPMLFKKDDLLKEVKKEDKKDDKKDGKAAAPTAKPVSKDDKAIKDAKDEEEAEEVPQK